MRTPFSATLIFVLLGYIIFSIPQRTDADQQASLSATINNTTYQYSDRTTTTTRALSNDKVTTSVTITNTTSNLIDNATVHLEVPDILNTEDNTKTISLEPTKSVTVEQTLTLKKLEQDGEIYNLRWGLTSNDTTLYSNTIQIIGSRPVATITIEQLEKSTTTATSQVLIHLKNAGTASMITPRLVIETENGVQISSIANNKLPQSTKGATLGLDTIYENEQREIPITLEIASTGTTTPIQVHIEYTDIQHNDYVATSASQELPKENTTPEPNKEPQTSEQEETPIPTTEEQTTLTPTASETPTPSETPTKSKRFPWIGIVIPALLGFVVALIYVITQNLKEFKEIERQRRLTTLQHSKNEEPPVPPPPTSEDIEETVIPLKKEQRDR